MTPFESAYDEVAKLVNQFAEHEDQYLSHKYQESEVRGDFIDKFWKALGWDVNHEYQTNPREQEVKVEKNPDSNASGRKADYAFYLKPDYRNPIFFCEAKKPRHDLGSPEFYFQLVRYGRAAGTPVSVLFDFEEFHVVDCRYEANLQKSFPSAQIKAFRYKDYLDRDKFGDIYWLFSREAVEAGKLKEFAKSLPKQRGKGAAKLTQEEAKPADETLLTKLEEYRLTLAKAFKKADESLDAETLTEATQKVIDRLVFIRFLEDKNIEADYIVDQIAAVSVRHPERSEGSRPEKEQTKPSARSFAAAQDDAPKSRKTRTAWDSFIAWSKELDVKYNGVVFKPHEIDKPSFIPPDDKVFGDICRDISFGHSKYIFSYIPIELIGSIYERFLGKVVTATAKRADIEYKPEVRKAGGVYYTPKYIVDYIVANTVGKILEDSPSSEAERKRRGAGGGAVPGPDSLAPDTPPQATMVADPSSSRGGGLSPKEVSKLRFADIACGSGSFLIAVYDAVLHHVESWYNAHPEEARKAKCIEVDTGVFALSLRQKQQILLDNIYGVDIDPQAVEVAQLSLFLKLLEGESGATAGQMSFEKTKILPDLSKNIRCGNSLVDYEIEQLFPLTPEEHRRINPFDFESQFKEIMGRGGFDAIVGNPPYVLLQSLDSRCLFEFLAKRYESATYKIDMYQTFMERSLDLIRDGGYFGYITPSSYLRNVHSQLLRQKILRKAEVDRIRVFSYPVFKGASVDTSVTILHKLAGVSPSHRIVVDSSSSPDTVTTDLIAQSKWVAHKFNHFSISSSGAEDVLERIRDAGFPMGQIATAYFGIQTFDRNKYVATEPLTPNFKPVIDGANVGRYTLSAPKEYVDFRPKAIKSGGKEKVYEQDRVVVRQIGETPIGTYVPAGIYALNTTYNIYRIVETQFELKFLLALIESSTIRFFWRQQFFDQKRTFPKIKKEALLSIPIPKLDLANPADRDRQNAIVQLASQMLESKAGLMQARRDSERDQLQRKCEYLDAQIDRLVYELYGLTEDEIKIVEGRWSVKN